MRHDDNTTRRAVLMGVGAGSLATVLAACGGDTQNASAEQPADSASSAPSAPAAGGALAATADIPVGGGKVFADQKVVVTQPTEGEFKASDATCTHQGCPVDAVQDGMIICPCHRSTFGLDGAVRSGPAPRGLDPVPVTVDGDQLILG